jgi:hypothetical protein
MGSHRPKSLEEMEGAEQRLMKAGNLPSVADERNKNA